MISKIKKTIPSQKAAPPATIKKTAPREVPVSDSKLEELKTNLMLAPKTILNIAVDETKSLSDEGKEAMLAMADTSRRMGQLMMDTSKAALMLGGHHKTWQDVARIGQELASISNNVSMLASCTSMLSLTAATNGVGLVVSALSIGMTLFGGNKGDGMGKALSAIMGAIYEMHRSMLQGFRNLEQLVNENMAMTVHRLNQVNQTLDRLERLAALSFKELHSMKLVEIGDAICKEIRGEYSLQDSEKKKYLRKLSTWMDFHSRAQIQTFLLRDSTDTSKCVSLLSSQDFDIAAMFPFFIMQLMHLLPARLLGNFNIKDLPNVAVLHRVCEIYTKAISHYHFNECYEPVLTRAKENFEQVLAIIDELKANSEEILDILLRQYELARYKTGRSLDKCRHDVSKFNRPGVTLQEHLKMGTNADRLMQTLDSLELRRLMLLHLIDICAFDEPTQNRIRSLESKNTILTRPAIEYETGCSIVYSCGAALYSAI